MTLLFSEFYVTSHIIHLTQYTDKTYPVKQMCASVILKLNIKLFFGIKHITQIKRHATRRQINVIVQNQIIAMLSLINTIKRS